MGTRRATVLVVIALVLLAPFLIRAVGWRPGYLLQVYSLIPIFLIAGLSLTVIMGYTGQISLAQAALMGMGAYGTAILSTRGVPIPLGILAALLLVAGGALLLGLPTLRLRGPYFVVTSLAFNAIFYEVVNSWIGVTRGPNGISGVPSLGRLGIIGPFVPWVLAFLCLWLVHRLGTTRLGKSMMATRDDELAASAIGLRVGLIKSIAFVISGLLAGIAGVLLAHLIGYVSPEFYSIDQSIFFLTLVLLGGVRRVEGAILGTILMVLAQEALRQFAHLQLLFYGIMMLLVIQFFPRGLISLTEKESEQQ